MNPQHLWIPTFTERNYNLEFCKELTTLIMERAGESLHLPDLLSVGEKVAGEELWLVEEAIGEFAKIPEVQLSEVEKEHLKQLVADLKEKHTAKVLETVERAARAFNPSADESRIQTVISNAIKTSNIKAEAPQEKMPIIKTQKPIKDEWIVKEESESEGQMKGADIVINWLNTL
jgi:hypothetical protein